MKEVFPLYFDESAVFGVVKGREVAGPQVLAQGELPSKLHVELLDRKESHNLLVKDLIGRLCLCAACTYSYISYVL